MRWSVLIVLGLCAACTRLPDRVVRLHRAPLLSRDGPVRVASSEPKTPLWASGVEEDLTFVGQSSGPSKKAARETALADLRESVARFLSVEVASDEETRAKSDEKLDQTEVRIDRRVFVSSRAETIQPDAEYWEQFSDGNYRVFLRAKLSEKALSAVRLENFASRARTAGREVIVILTHGELAGKLGEELAARLEGDARFAVIDRELGPEARALADRVIELDASNAPDGCALRLLVQHRGGEQKLEKIVAPKDRLELEDLAAEMLLSALRGGAP